MVLVNEPKMQSIPAQMGPEGSARPAAWLEGGTALLDEQARILEVNRVWAEYFGASSAAFCGHRLSSLLGARYPEVADVLARWELGARGFQVLDLPVVTRDGVAAAYRLESARSRGGWWVRLNSMLPANAELAESAWDAHLRGEPAMRQMFVRLLRAESRLEELRRQWPGVIFAQRPDLTFESVSASIEELTGVSAAVWGARPSRFWQVVHEADADEVKQQLRRCAREPGGVTTTYRVRHLQSGRVAYILEQRRAVRSEEGLLLAYEGVWLDVTRQTIAEKRLLSAAWKETLGVLTMGLAHDFSNIIAGVHSLSESFLDQIGADHPFHEGLMLIKRNSRLAGELAHRIINLHRGKTGERIYVDLNEVVRDAVELVSKIVPRRIVVKMRLATMSLPAYVDPVGLRQVIVNLTRNAVDAMPQSGEICLETSRHETAPGVALLVGNLPRLPCLRLAVQDTGTGIGESQLRHIFDPFFTTKPVNEGSGLGLYNARLYLEKHQGGISVESVVGLGTTFALWLPEATFQEGEMEEAVVVAARRLRWMVVGQSGKRLESVAEVLRIHNCQVLTATTPEGASALMEAPECGVDGVLALMGSSDAALVAWLGNFRARHPRLPMALQVVGCNRDEMSDRFMKLFDVVIEPDLAEAEMVDRLQVLCRHREG